MASTSTPETNDLLIERFRAVTGSSRHRACEMLEACKWNLEMAISRHVNSNPLEDPVNDVDDDGDVRPPILPTRCVLVEDDFDFCYTLRNRKRRRLSASFNLFQRPHDLMFRGNFMAARDYGERSNRWLMVNIQDLQEIACQVLNRDVWSDPAMKNLIKEHFVFWQVHEASLDGERYVQFYAPVEFPYVAVIDPRTGEKMAVWHDTEASTMHDLVERFLEEYSTPNGTSEVNSSGDCNLMDESEDDSNLTESSLEDSDNEIEILYSDFETCEDSTADVRYPGNSNEKEKTWKDYLGSEGGPKTELVIRLPDGRREQITWPSTTKIKALLLYIGELGYDTREYELVANFPKRNLCRLDSSQALEEAGLFSREVVVVQEK